MNQLFYNIVNGTKCSTSITHAQKSCIIGTVRYIVRVFFSVILLAMLYNTNVQSTYNYICLKVQATVVGALAAFAAVIMGWVLDGEFNIHHATLLCASSLVTASLASLILGSVMVAVVLCSRKCNINPDNVATPIAASLGDLTTLALLSAISRFLHSCIGKFYIQSCTCRLESLIPHMPAYRYPTQRTTFYNFFFFLPSWSVFFFFF